MIYLPVNKQSKKSAPHGQQSPNPRQRARCSTINCSQWPRQGNELAQSIQTGLPSRQVCNEHPKQSQFQGPNYPQRGKTEARRRVYEVRCLPYVLFLCRQARIEKHRSDRPIINRMMQKIFLTQSLSICYKQDKWKSLDFPSCGGFYDLFQILVT